MVFVFFLLLVATVIYMCQRDEAAFIDAGGYNAEAKAFVVRHFFITRAEHVEVIFSFDNQEYKKVVQVFGDKKIQEGDSVLVRFNRGNPTWKVMLSSVYEDLQDNIKEYHGY